MSSYFAHFRPPVRRFSEASFAVWGRDGQVSTVISNGGGGAFWGVCIMTVSGPDQRVFEASGSPSPLYSYIFAIQLKAFFSSNTNSWRA